MRKIVTNLKSNQQHQHHHHCHCVLLSSIVHILPSSLLIKAVNVFSELLMKTRVKARWRQIGSTLTQITQQWKTEGWLMCCSWHKPSSNDQQKVFTLISSIMCGKDKVCVCLSIYDTAADEVNEVSASTAAHTARNWFWRYFPQSTFSTLLKGKNGRFHEQQHSLQIDNVLTNKHLPFTINCNTLASDLMRQISEE